MTDLQRQRDLALELSRYLDGDGPFPDALSAEDIDYLDRLVFCHESLIDISHEIHFAPVSREVFSTTNKPVSSSGRSPYSPRGANDADIDRASASDASRESTVDRDTWNRPGDTVREPND